LEIKSEAKFKDDLDADSIDLIEFVICLEEEFDIEIPEYRDNKIITVEDAVHVAEEHINKRIE